VAVTRVLLVGAHGYGRVHLRAMAAMPGATLVGVCDLRPPDDELRELAGDVPCSADLGGLLASLRPDIAIVSTPIHTHVDLALAAARGGAAVLLEKPPAPSLAEFRRLREGLAATGRPCQIGFQSLGSGAVEAVRGLVADGTIGRLTGIGIAGAWVRTGAYYARTGWAGKREVNCVPVVDGALTNPFAHALTTALRIDGSDGPDGVAAVTLELYRANPIEADDTACARVVTAAGTTITAAVTLAAERDHDPLLLLHGTRGRITLWYTRDRVLVETAGGKQEHTYPRTGLLENLAAHLADPSVALLVPPERTAAFMQVVDAVRRAPDPTPIPADHVRVEQQDGWERRIVPGIDAAIATSAERLALFSDLDLPWTA
jgi:predicted dehydrogenase